MFTEAPYKDITSHEVSETIQEIAGNLKRFCGAEVNCFILEKSQNEVLLY